MLATITKVELQTYFEKLFYQPNRANRFDMHWNSQPHMQQKQQPEEEEKKGEDEQPSATETTEEEIVPTYETELRHPSVAQFKMSMSLFADNYKLNFASNKFNH